MSLTADGARLPNESALAINSMDYDSDHPRYNFSLTGDIDPDAHPCADVSEFSNEVDEDCLAWYISEYGHYNETQNGLEYSDVWEIVPVALVYGITLLLGVIGNSLVIVAIARNRRMQTVTNAFLTSLASADLILVLLCVPIKFVKFISFSWTFGLVMCKLVHYLQNVSVICSILTLTAMSMERYYAILHPMRAKFLCTADRARRVIASIWVLSVLLAIPILFGQIHKKVGMVIEAYWCIREWPDQRYSITFEIGMLLLIFVFPLIIITVAYANICRELWRMTQMRASLRAGDNYQRPCVSTNGCRNGRGILARRKPKTSSDDDRTRKQVIKMLVTVIALFAICWGPLLINNVLVAFGLIERYNYDHYKPLRQAFALMAYFNSCVNPIVYAFMSRNFRDSFRQTVCVCTWGARHNQRQVTRQSSFNTRTSTLSVSRGASVKYELCPDPNETLASRVTGGKKLLVQHAPETEIDFSESETGL